MTIKGARIAETIFETKLDLSHPINFGMPRNALPILEILILIEPNKIVTTTQFNKKRH
jgi:hypothetical protein